VSARPVHRGQSEEDEDDDEEVDEVDEELEDEESEPEEVVDAGVDEEVLRLSVR
jgi:hypothetical protein